MHLRPTIHHRRSAERLGNAVNCLKIITVTEVKSCGKITPDQAFNSFNWLIKNEVVHGQRRVWHHETGQDPPPQHPETGERQLRSRIARSGTHQHHGEAPRIRLHQKDLTPLADLGVEQHMGISVKDQLIRPEINAGGDGVLLGLQRGDQRNW